MDGIQGKFMMAPNDFLGSGGNQGISSSVSVLAEIDFIIPWRVLHQRLRSVKRIKSHWDVTCIGMAGGSN